MASGPLALGSRTPLNAVEMEVFSTLSRYGRSVVVERKLLANTVFRVEVSSIAAFTDVFDPENLPFERIYVGSGNAMKVTHRGTEFTILNNA